MFKVLAIDGGGIRGVLPASFLAKLNADIGPKNLIGNYFDLIAGTSTGAIIAFGLALGIDSGQG